jgi:hypothetical protein
LLYPSPQNITFCKLDVTALFTGFSRSQHCFTEFIAEFLPT